MPCISPLEGWRARQKNSTGKRSIVFSLKDGLVDEPVTLPCGRCIGCRLERSRQWAVRCVHEAKLHERNCFITLTYNNENLPSDQSLNKKHFQDFIKRLRKRFGEGVRYYHCGEYGDKNKRPHYHACLFNFDFDDKVLWKVAQGNKLWVSKALSELWPFGFSSIGEVTFESAAYVARYVMKKINGDKAKEPAPQWHEASGSHVWVNPYERVSDSGEVWEVQPEYTTMSRRPGIGKKFFENYKGDMYPHDRVVLRGKEQKPPKAYDKYLEVDDPEMFEYIKKERKIAMLEHEFEDPRYSVKEEIMRLKLAQLKRGMYNE